MNTEPSRPQDLPRSLEELRTRFRDDLRSGVEPKLEDYWAQAGESASEDFLRQLIMLELESRPSDDATISVAMLFERYRNLPISATAIQEAFDEWKSTVSTGQRHGDESLIVNTVISKTPQTIDRYEIREQLGQGSFGTVYQAWDPKLEREVALKVPHEHLVSNPEVRERYLREARAVSAIRHSGICPIYEIHDQADSSLLLSLAFIEGETLGSYLGQRGTLSNSRAADICTKIAEAVHQAHQRGVLHRDLKPQNILMSAEDGHPVVTDFGLARRTQSEDATLTQEGAIVGTPAYMSPEQARGEMENLSVATDVYSLGVILFELLAGRRPFAGKSLKILSQIVNDEPPRVSALNPSVDPRLEDICHQAMAKRADERYATMNEFAEALQQFVSDSSAHLSNDFGETLPQVRRTQVDDQTSTRQFPPPRSRRVIWGLGIAFIVLLATTLGIVFRGGSSLDQSEIVSNPATSAPENEEPVAARPISKVTGKWRIYSSLLPDDGGLLEILENGEVKLILSDSVKAKSALIDSRKPFFNSSPELFLTAVSPSESDGEDIPDNLAPPEPGAIPEFRPELRESRVKTLCEVVPQNAISPVSIQGFHFPDAEYVTLSMTSEIVDGIETFPITSLSINERELWSLQMIDSDHLFGERQRITTYPGSKESLNIAFDHVTLIRDSAYRGDPLPPNHWLSSQPRYTPGPGGDPLTYLFLPDGQFMIGTNTRELYGGRNSLGGLRLTYRVLEIQDAAVKMEIRRLRDEDVDAPSIPMWNGPTREIWTCQRIPAPDQQRSQHNVKVTRQSKMVEVRERLKTVFKEVDGKQVPVQVTESVGVEVPVEMEMMLSADPEGASEPPNSETPAPTAVPR